MIEMRRRLVERFAFKLVVVVGLDEFLARHRGDLIRRFRVSLGVEDELFSLTLSDFRCYS